MKTGTNTLLRYAALPTVVLAALLLSCSGDATDEEMDASSVSATAITTDAVPDSATDNTDMNGSTDRYNATGQMDPNGNYTDDGLLRPGVVLSPSQERADAEARMMGIRATLMTELDEVRNHLNDGTLDKDHTAADKQRAADLAQGLERVDRALAAMDSATDATWAAMRAAQLKEVDEVRTWWNAHMAERDAMAKR